DYPRFMAQFRRFVPTRYHGVVGEIAEKADVAVGGYLRGQLMITAILGLFVWIGLTILGVPLATAIAFLAAVFNLVPYLGPVIGAVPAVLLGLTVSPLTALLAIVVFVVANQLEGNVLSPLVLSRATNLHPLTVLLAIMTGLGLFGLVGALLAEVHQVVGAPQEGLGVVAVDGVRGHADGGGEAHAVDLDLGDELGEALGGSLRLGGANLGQQQHELVAGPAEGVVGGAQLARQRLGDRDERGVAGGVPEAVVDLLEVVEVDHHQVERVPVALGARQLGLQPALEALAVAQSRQPVGDEALLEPPDLLRLPDDHGDVLGERLGDAQGVGAERGLRGEAVDVEQRHDLRAVGDRDRDVGLDLLDAGRREVRRGP